MYWFSYLKALVQMLLFYLILFKIVMSTYDQNKQLDYAHLWKEQTVGLCPPMIRTNSWTMPTYDQNKHLDYAHLWSEQAFGLCPPLIRTNILTMPIMLCHIWWEEDDRYTFRHFLSIIFFSNIICNFVSPTCQGQGGILGDAATVTVAW